MKLSKKIILFILLMFTIMILSTCVKSTTEVVPAGKKIYRLVSVDKDGVRTIVSYGR
jgi:hypothetical protein